MIRMRKLRKWITDGSGKAFYARKEFALEKIPEKAVVCVCGLGQFNFYVNGKKVSDHVLDPAWTDYRKIVYYVTFDIVPYLQEGQNVLAAEVGNGWYLADWEEGYFFHFPPFMPPNPNPYRPFDKELVLAVCAELSFGDGETMCIEADETWKTAPHMITHTNCFGSETVDGRKRIPGWNEPEPEAGNWENARIADSGGALSLIAEEQKIPPVKVIRTYEGRCIKCENGISVYDFGQNVSGMLEFEVKGSAGQEVHAYPAEKLGEDGSVDQMAKNWMPIDVKETYVIASAGEWEHFAMTFTYFGGRYAAVDCAQDSIRNIRLHAVSSCGENAGTFWCDDERYMQIYHLIEKSVEANMIGVHTDCPTIERFAWQEENHLMAPSIMYMKQVKAHWEKFLTDTRLSQHTADDWFYDMEHGKYYPGDGLIPSQAPCYLPNVLPVPGLGDFYNIIGWGSSIILGTYWHYMFYGDEKIIRENYEAGRKYLEFLKTTMTREGFISHGLGDWGNPDGQYAKENIETAFLFADAKILSLFAGILEQKEEQEQFEQFAEQICENYNRRLLEKDEKTGRYGYRVRTGDGCSVLTQAAQAMPLFWGMVPQDKEQDVAETFRRILEKDGCLRTGEVGQPYIIQMMKKYGMNDLLCDMILKPEHPSYYAFVLEGETCLGEYWEENPRSHCHDMMGHIAEWFYNGLAGICPVEPGFKKVLIRPYLPKTVNKVNCSYRSAGGNIRIIMERTQEKISLEVNAPDDMEITIDRSNLE